MRHICLCFWCRPQTLTSCSSSKTLQSTGNPAEMGVALYSKQFVHSKSSQYRRMKAEWKSNVYLARSRIQVERSVWLKIIRKNNDFMGFSSLKDNVWNSMHNTHTHTHTHISWSVQMFCKQRIPRLTYCIWQNVLYTKVHNVRCCFPQYCALNSSLYFCMKNN